jgi:hypothetical protein
MHTVIKLKTQFFSPVTFWHESYASSSTDPKSVYCKNSMFFTHFKFCLKLSTSKANPTPNDLKTKKFFFKFHNHQRPGTTKFLK